MTSTTTPRAWMRLPSGGRLDLINPDPHAWTDSDLAARLSRTFRWGGESAWPNPLSVAQHSLFVLELRRITCPEPMTADEQLLELLHDAEEGLLGFDCISPLKPVLGTAFRVVSERLSTAIAWRYELKQWTDATHSAHKIADRCAAASEAVHCIGWSVGEVREVLGVSDDILDADPLAEVHKTAPWEPWPSWVAARRFEAELDRLLKMRTERSS